MNNLHDIRGPNMTRWIWHNVSGGNGRRIGGGVAHAFPIERGQPPVPAHPVEERDAFVRQIGWQRQGWNPYQPPTAWGNPAAAIAMLRLAACRGVKSASRWPRFNGAWEGQRMCPDCAAVAPDAALHNDVVQRDPWANIAWNERGWTVDPISGV